MDTLKISYSVYAKYKDHLYCRVRESGKTMDINLHTTDKSAADNYVRLRRSEVDLYNRYVLAGESVPDDVANKIVRIGAATSSERKVPKLRECYDQFELYLHRKGKRPLTVNTYLKSIRLTVPLDLPLSAFTRTNVRDWLATHDNTKTATRKSYSVATREFAKYLISNYDLDPRILNDWPMTKVVNSTKGYWTMAEMANIIRHVQCVDPVAEQSYKAYYWFLATTGARQGEAGLIEWRDIKDGTVTIRAENNKTNTERTIPLDFRILEMIFRLPHDSRLVFSHISHSQAGRYAVLAKAIKRAKAPHGGLHTFRHSVACLAYKATSDIKATAQYLCHSEATALRYYQATREADDLRTVVDRTFGGEILIPNAMDDLIEKGLI